MREGGSKLLIWLDHHLLKVCLSRVRFSLSAIVTAQQPFELYPCKGPKPLQGYVKCARNSRPETSEVCISVYNVEADCAATRASADSDGVCCAGAAHIGNRSARHAAVVRVKSLASTPVTDWLNVTVKLTLLA